MCGSRKFAGFRALGAGVLLLLATACASSSKTMPGAALTAPDIASPDRNGDLRIGPLDTLDVKVFGVQDLNGTYQVDPGGQVKIPLIGPVEAKGLTTFELADSIEQMLSERFIKNPQVNIRVAQPYGQQLTVEGSVGRPGMYPVTGEMTLLKAIALSGGLLDTADKRRVVIFRQINGERKAGAFNMEGIRSGEQPDPPVYGNDIIVVDGSDAKATYMEVLRTIPLVGFFMGF
jgi:polysaccharide export outer membrane protein